MWRAFKIECEVSKFRSRIVMVFLCLLRGGLVLAGDPSPIDDPLKCPDKVITALTRIMTENGAVPAQQYHQTNSRSLADLREILGEDFHRTQRQWSSGSNIVDSGGGFSVYGLELGGVGHHVTTINAQDFYSEVLYPLGDTKEAERFLRAIPLDGNGRVLIRAGGLNGNTLHHLAQVLKIEVPKSFYFGPHDVLTLERGISLETAARDLSSFVQSIKQKVLTLEHQGNFKRVVGFAQDELPRIPANSTDGILDAIGAYYYSGTRIALLQEFYRILKPGAKAYIAITELEDHVKVGTTTTGFGNFLERAYPNIFKVERRGMSAILIMTKVNSHDLSTMHSMLGKPRISWVRRGDGYSYPVLNYDSNQATYGAADGSVSERPAPLPRELPQSEAYAFGMKTTVAMDPAISDLDTVYQGASYFKLSDFRFNEIISTVFGSIEGVQFKGVASTRNVWLESKLNEKARLHAPMKVYISIPPERMPEDLPSIVREAKTHSADAMKFAATAAGLARPDRIVVYFDSVEKGIRFAEAMETRYQNLNMQGDHIPFTHRVGKNPKSPISIGFDSGSGPFSESWRQRVAKAISEGLEKCLSVPFFEVRLRCLNEHLFASGIDANTWLPVKYRNIGIQNAPRASRKGALRR